MKVTSREHDEAVDALYGLHARLTEPECEVRKLKHAALNLAWFDAETVRNYGTGDDNDAARRILLGLRETVERKLTEMAP